MTSVEQIYALIKGVLYVSTNAAQRAILECGVRKGGGMTVIARTLLQVDDVKRDIPGMKN